VPSPTAAHVRVQILPVEPMLTIMPCDTHVSSTKTFFFLFAFAREIETEIFIFSRRLIFRRAFYLYTEPDGRRSHSRRFRDTGP